MLSFSPANGLAIVALINKCSILEPILTLSTGGSGMNLSGYPGLEEPALFPKNSEAEGLFSNELFGLLLDSSPDCIQVLDSLGMVRLMNRAGQRLLGSQSAADLNGRPWIQIFPADQRLKASQALLEARLGKQATFNAFAPAPLGRPRWWNVTVIHLAVDRAQSGRYLVLSRDISEQMQVEKALRESEEAFRRVFEENPLGMALSTLDFHITKVNNALCGMIGFAPDELMGRDIRAFMTGETARFENDYLEKLLLGELRSFQLETQFATKRQTTVWAHITTSIVRDAEQQPLYMVQMIENISERKQSEEQLLAYQEQLQSLASEVSLSEERERRRIATSLHDRIGQTLAFARLKLGALSQAAPEQIRADNFSEIRELIEQAIVDTRSLTFDLSPPVLYELGLVPAVEWLTRKMQQEHGIQTRFHDDGQPKPLDENFRIVLFSAVRELLFNVVKHAGASHAQVLMRRDADALRIIIEDDGVGFDVHALQNPREPARGFGLFNIRERVEYLGGRVKIRSETRHGTRITLIAPLRFENHNEHQNHPGRRS
jgi:PAS domain S-box-containing protein